MFSIAICRQIGDKWQSKTVSNEFYLRSSSVLEFSIAYDPVCDYAACNNVLDFQTLKISLSIAKIVFLLLKTIFLTVGMHFLRFLRIEHRLVCCLLN